MKIKERILGDILIIQLEPHVDERGSFTEAFSERALEELGVSFRVLQDNVALSRQSGCVRGLHYQKEPYAQNMLMMCLNGEIDVLAVDCRYGSPSFGKSAVVRLCAGDDLLVYLPKGFARGTLARKPDSRYSYKVDAFYNGDPSYNGGISCLYDKNELDMEKLLEGDTLVLSERDRNGLCRTLAELPQDFVYRKG